MRRTLSRVYASLRSNIPFLVILSLLLATYTLWWLAFYPGVMTADSLDQWRQALAGSYNDAHPFTSTLYMNAFRWIHDTPAWVGWTQVVGLSLTVAGFLGYAWRRRVSWKIIAPIVALFMIWPVYGIYTITIWKDILYSIAIVAVSLLTFVLIADKRAARQRWLFVMLAMLATSIALWRHNGIVYLILPFAALYLFCSEQRKTTIRSFGLTLALYIVMHFGMAHLLHVRPAPLVAEWLRMKTVAAVYHEKHPTISPADRRVFESFMPESAWQQGYKCLHTDTTAMAFTSYQPLTYEDTVSRNPRTEAAWKKAVINTAAHNPTAIAKDRVCVAKTLFDSKPGYIKYATDILVRPDLPAVQAKPLGHTQAIKQHLINWLSWSATSGTANFIFWSALPALALTVLYGILAIKFRMRATLAYVVLMLANPLFVVLIGSSSDYRYIYSLVMGAPLLPVAYLIEAKTKHRHS